MDRIRRTYSSSLTSGNGETSAGTLMMKLGQKSGPANEVVLVDDGIGREAGLGRRIGLKKNEKTEVKTLILSRSG